MTRSVKLLPVTPDYYGTTYIDQSGGETNINPSALIIVLMPDFVPSPIPAPAPIPVPVFP